MAGKISFSSSCFLLTTDMKIANCNIISVMKYHHRKPMKWASFHQVLVQQPQILKTDSLVLTTQPDGTQVLSTMQSPTGITTLTTPIQSTALQVPVSTQLELATRSRTRRRVFKTRSDPAASSPPADADEQQHFDHRARDDGRRGQAAHQAAAAGLHPHSPGRGAVPDDGGRWRCRR